MKKDINCPLCDWIYSIEAPIEENTTWNKEALYDAVKTMLCRNLGEHIYNNHLK